MAKSEDAGRKALEEFDNRVRELLIQRAELDKKAVKKGAKKRAKRTPEAETKKVVVEQNSQAPIKTAEELALAERKLVSLLFNVVVKNDFGGMDNISMAKELIQSALDTMTPEQIEKVRVILTPTQMGGLRQLWELVKKTGAIAP
ncbi:MAG TPA: hypothetical protein PK156_16090 [Polyangium sp.]|nr:hypothetical protein [Polyangium sp.]